MMFWESHFTPERRRAREIIEELLGLGKRLSLDDMTVTIAAYGIQYPKTLAKELFWTLIEEGIGQPSQMWGLEAKESGFLTEQKSSSRVKK